MVSELAQKNRNEKAQKWWRTRTSGRVLHPELTHFMEFWLVSSNLVLSPLHAVPLWSSYSAWWGHGVWVDRTPEPLTGKQLPSGLKREHTQAWVRYEPSTRFSADSFILMIIHLFRDQPVRFYSRSRTQLRNCFQNVPILKNVLIILRGNVFKIFYDIVIT